MRAQARNAAIRSRDAVGRVTLGGDAVPEQLAIDRQHAGGGRVPGEAQRAQDAGLAHAPARARVAEDREDPFGVVAGIVALDEVTGDPVLDHVPETADRGRDHRRRAGLRPRAPPARRIRTSRGPAPPRRRRRSPRGATAAAAGTGSRAPLRRARRRDPSAGPPRRRGPSRSARQRSRGRRRASPRDQRASHLGDRSHGDFWFPLCACDRPTTAGTARSSQVEPRLGLAPVPGRDGRGRRRGGRCGCGRLGPARPTSCAASTASPRPAGPRPRSRALAGQTVRGFPDARRAKGSRLDLPERWTEATRDAPDLAGLRAYPARSRVVRVDQVVVGPLARARRRAPPRNSGRNRGSSSLGTGALGPAWMLISGSRYRAPRPRDAARPACG